MSSSRKSLSFLEKQIKLLNNRESYISIAIGFSFVIVVSVLVYSIITRYNSNLAKPYLAQNTETTSQKEVLGVETYIVEKRDDLWKIAEKVYGDGFAWLKIAKANKLDKPNTIHPENKLIIPK